MIIQLSLFNFISFISSSFFSLGRGIFFGLEGGWLGSWATGDI